ncbi:MAG: flavodoxin family protein [Brevundimonas sp.]
MAKVLVVFYSRSGTTAAAARQLAGRLEADVDEIRPIRPYSGVAGFLRCIFEATRRDRPEITTGRNPADYRMVVLGSPVWAGCLASPMRSYLSAHHCHLPATSAFCTSGSGMAEPVFRQIRQILGERPLQSTLSLSQKAVLSGAASEEIRRWASNLQAQPRAISVAA